MLLRLMFLSLIRLEMERKPINKYRNYIKKNIKLVDNTSVNFISIKTLCKIFMKNYL